MRYGMLELAKIGVNIQSCGNVSAFVGARRINSRLENNSIVFDKPIVIPAGSSLKISVGK
jgi:hypothetical protein